MRTPIEHVAADDTQTWKVRLRRFDAAKGRMVNSSETFPTEESATEFCRLMAAIGTEAALAYIDEQAGRRLKSFTGAGTYADWFDRYLDSLSGVEPETVAGYRSLHSNYLEPTLGAIPADAVDRTVVAKLVNALAAQPHSVHPDRTLSAKTIANAHGLLSSVMSFAVDEGAITSNPCSRTRLPRGPEHEQEDIRFLTHDEFWRLHDNTLEHYRPMLVFLVGTGCRWSEASALQVRDVDLAAATVRIVRSWKRRRGDKALPREQRTGFVLGPPKSPKSRRTITLPPDVVTLLRPLVADQPRTAFVFRSARLGRPVHRANFYNRVWRPACDAAGLGGPRPWIHDLRHTHASWLIALGIELEVIQERLGHDSYLTTRNLYVHLRPDMHIRAARAAAVALDRPPELSPGSGGSAETPGPER